MFGRFQNFRVCLATGILLLNLPDMKTGDRFAKGTGESDTGETSGLLLLLRPLSPSFICGDAGGDTSSG